MALAGVSSADGPKVVARVTGAPGTGALGTGALGLAEVEARGGWAGGVSAWLGSALQDSNPFNTPWRRDQGGLWDVGPHMVSLLWASLGPVTSVTADRGPADVTHLVLHHQGGATSTTTLTLSAT